MDEAVPATTKTWRVTGYDGFDSLKFSEEPLPKVGDNEVLVRSRLLPQPLFRTRANNTA